MTHSDDEGLVLPPRVAPVVLAIVPIYRKDEEKGAVLAYARRLLVQLCGEEAVAMAESGIGNRELLQVAHGSNGQRVVLDLRDGLRPPEKFFQWEQKGVPIRLEVGPRDMQNEKAMVVTRHDREKSLQDAGALTSSWLGQTLDAIQAALLDRARDNRTQHTWAIDSYDDLKTRLDAGGFFLIHWDGTTETELRLQEETKATIRCIPFDDVIEGAEGPINLREPGKDILSGKPSKGRVVVARAY
jgi:prolyl-tRNA synthetase